MKTLAAAVVLLLFVRVIGADEKPVGAKAAGPATAARASLRVRPADHAALLRALEKRLTVDFVEKPLEEVVELLAEKAGVPILIDANALEEEGVPLDEPVTQRTKNASIRTVFARILDPLNLTLITKGSAVVVTSTVVAEELRHLDRAAYDLRDLVERISPTEPDIGSRQRTYQSVEGAHGCGQCGLHPSDDVIDAVTRLLGPPESWADQGGPGDIAYRDGLLFVRTTQSIQRDVDALLTEIDTITRAEPSDAFVRVLESPAEKRIRAALSDSVSVAFDEKPLVEALDWLGKQARVEVLVDRIALEEEGIPLDEPVTLELRDVPLESVLLHLLEPLNLLWIVKNDALVVTSDVVSEELGNLRVAVADVRDIADGGLDELFDTIIRLLGAPESWADQGGPGDVSIVGQQVLVVRQSMATLDEIERLLAETRSKPRTKAPSTQPSDDDVLLLDYTFDAITSEQVIALIRTFVDPNGWENGTSTIRVVDGQLFILTTRANHVKIDALLSRLKPTLPPILRSNGSGPFGLD